MNAVRRRALLAVPVAAAVARDVAAQPAVEEDFAAAERAILAGRTPVAGGIAIDMPQLSENGNSVDLAIKVESAMTATDHVTAIHILAEKNPVPRVARFALSPRAGRAEVATRIRLATTQTILVLAETSTGQVHRASRDVIVILGACVDGG
ncbi:thiosulfate oxidation carrier protein SoxY [Falsiroseomonas oryzae]|uniref:thiosulfate oxidation carrier protein SoxY n=1 Tax=Falsiroseomonas oryzae TaxID=2766473 RepID=UPI0022EA3718|nr:thiosulfate oxidation carrier protein SoxY [Roseomonas sp. MO-31]